MTLARWRHFVSIDDCGQRQSMSHIVDTCPLTKFEGGLNLLHEVDDDTIINGWKPQQLQHSRNEMDESMNRSGP